MMEETGDHSIIIGIERLEDAENAENMRGKRDAGPMRHSRICFLHLRPRPLHARAAGKIGKENKSHERSLAPALDTAKSSSKLAPRPKTEGTRPQAEISPSEAYSIGHPAPACWFVPCASLVSRTPPIDQRFCTPPWPSLAQQRQHS